MKIGIREMICVLLVLGIPPAFWWSVYRPMGMSIAAVEKEYQTKKEKLEKLENDMKRDRDPSHEIEQLTEALALFEAKLPSEKEVDVILKDVSQLALRHGLKTRSVRADPAKKTTRPEVELKMIIRGDFDGFYSFLLEVERLTRITQVPQMKLAKFKGGVEGEMEAEFTLKIFYEGQPAPTDKVADAR